MGIFNIFKGKKEKNDIMKFNNLHIHYVTERKEGVESVIGKEGYVNISDGTLILCCGGDTLFKGDISSLTASELLSHDGVILSGYDIYTQAERMLVVYFKYYRK